MALVQVRYFAGAAAAAGVDHDAIDLPTGSSAADLTAALAVRHPALAPVLEVASLLVDELAVRDATTVLDGAVQVDVLPPFAGG